MALDIQDPINLFELMSNSSINKWKIAILEKWSMSIYDITIDQWIEFRRIFGNKCNGLGKVSVDDFDRAVDNFKNRLNR